MFLPMDNFSNDYSRDLGEIADILALGLQRLNARKSSLISLANRDSPLDFNPGSPGDVPRKHEEIDT